jgi:hypothetical protein
MDLISKFGLNDKLVTIDKSVFAVYIYLVDNVKDRYFLSKSLKNLISSNNDGIIECNLDVDNKDNALGIEILFSNEIELIKCINYLSQFTKRIEDITTEEFKEGKIIPGQQK